MGDLHPEFGHRRGSRGGSWRPLLAHLGSRPERARRVRMRADKCRAAATLDEQQLAAAVAVCERLRDRVLITLPAEKGCGSAQQLGLRHNDIDVAARVVAASTQVTAYVASSGQRRHRSGHRVSSAKSRSAIPHWAQ